MTKKAPWTPLQQDKLDEIATLFSKIFPSSEYGDLAEQIVPYWNQKLKEAWDNKEPAIKDLDLAYDTSDPLSRISEEVVAIVYADSVSHGDEPTLDTLDAFLDQHFPAIGGLHMLPACQVAEGRFNDGYFSQVVRDRIHPSFGSNERFARLMAKHYSMADFVLNHVDTDNPIFQDYLAGNDEAADCFFIFSEQEYQQRLDAGDFAKVFRPRPFPLFTIFRRNPTDPDILSKTIQERVEMACERLSPWNVDPELVALFSIFAKVKNDQMLLDDEAALLQSAVDHLRSKGVEVENLFTVSAIQETQNTPWIFTPTIQNLSDLLKGMGWEPDQAQDLAQAYQALDAEIFGEPIRALTTFSHVQVDLNTATLAGLKLLADDFSWYLSMDFNMLRLDAANFAFKAWGTTCFGLPQVSWLMKVLYSSMDSVSPRMVANLEVNDQLSSVLTQMSDKTAPPPMMYDFHLSGITPSVFNLEDCSILPRIFEMIDRYDVPSTSIRFSLAESHDGKSVRGSMDILTIAERQALADTVQAGGGRVKFKSVRARFLTEAEWERISTECDLDRSALDARIFLKEDGGYALIDEIQDEAALLKQLDVDAESNKAIKFLLNKLLHGREPYELCCSTRDALTLLDNEDLETERYLSFYTLAFALMGRNVKSVYFNDLLGLPNDTERMGKTGELRDLKRTKSDRDQLAQQLQDSSSFTARVAPGMNALIELVNEDPALGCQGSEAQVLQNEGLPRQVAALRCHHGDEETFVLVNLSAQSQRIEMKEFQSTSLTDRLTGQDFPLKDGQLKLTMAPYQRLWLKA